ncbi:related to nitrogen metabolic regulation protein nmr [Serendipita indica DSM 11827]|uniref:Related to nitrogen metabolic regulation protein nmr n=1 Tax=Serendipita indica (strain DSM 11827) TaxID=1109443 RepID=G4TZ33_SERID|nr:related to nitrogen metabolic regulation protein nmr [Serendipita indica DSM 11827]
MSSKQVIVVFTATGKTGGGMIDAILNDGQFAARAVTRNPESDAAKALAAKGVQVVKGDLSDPASIEAALSGAYGVFGVTDYWQAFGNEEKQGKDLVDAAKRAGIKHFVWTTLDHSDLKVTHFETKANVDDYLKESGVPRTSLYTSFFLENLRFPQMIKINRSADGTVVFDVPFKTDSPLPMIFAGDIGKAALVAFKNPEQWIGKDLKIVTEWATPRDIAKTIESELGEKVTVKEVDDAQWKASRAWPNFEELWLNIEYFNTFYPEGNGRSVELTREIIPNATTLKSFIQAEGKSLIQ